MFLDTVLGTIGNQGSMSKGAHRVGFCRTFWPMMKKLFNIE
jgi:hypothetical protein